MRHFFYSLITFVIALFFLLLGLAGMIVPWIPAARTAFIQFLLKNTIAIFLFGFAFFIIGLAIAINVILSSRRKYYTVRSGKKAISIDQNLIQECLATYFKAQFPQKEIPFNLILKHNNLHISVDLPYVPIDQQKMTLERIENDLSHIFTSTLGYRSEFFLSASFKRKPDTSVN